MSCVFGSPPFHSAVVWSRSSEFRCCSAAGITFVFCVICLPARNCLLSPLLPFCLFVADILNRECLTGEPVLMWHEDWRDPHGKPETSPIKVFSEHVHRSNHFCIWKIAAFVLGSFGDGETH